MPEPFAVVSVAEMRALEAAVIEAGTPERVLQERAGLAVADVIEAEVSARARMADPSRDQRTRVVVLVGAGNNGRDAVVAGRRLATRGCQVEVWHGSGLPLTSIERQILTSEGVRLLRFDDDGFAPHLEAVVEASDFVIDGLLGVGSRGPMRPEMARVAGVVNQARSRQRRAVVAVDVPSGIDADDGSVPGVAVHADITVTFGAVKTGLLRFPAAEHVGRLVAAPIGLLPGHASAFPVQILDASRVRSFVPTRAADAHKYRVGRVLVVAGSDQYVGAAGLASEAAARAGAGLVGLVSAEAVKRVLATRLPEATYPLTLSDLEHDPERAAGAVADLLPEQSALLVGPGVGRSSMTNRFLLQLLALNGARATPTPTVIDADALSLLAGWTRWWQRIGTGNVLTPHSGEMALLVASDSDLPSIGGEPPWQTARRAAEKWQQIVVLKGPFTTVAQPDGRAWIYPHANAALATAGTGDVLAGLTAGLVAQGIVPAAAAQLAVVTHALAARRVTKHHGARTLLASDLPDELPATLAALATDALLPFA